MSTDNMKPLDKATKRINLDRKITSTFYDAVNYSGVFNAMIAELGRIEHVIWKVTYSQCLPEV